MTQTTLNSEAFLRKFHAQYAGATANLRAARASDGRTSYERLAQLVPGGRESITVLDWTARSSRSSSISC